MTFVLTIKTSTVLVLMTTAVLLTSLTGCEDEKKTEPAKHDEKGGERLENKAQRLEDKADRLENKAEQREEEVKQREAEKHEREIERENEMDRLENKVDPPHENK